MHVESFEPYIETPILHIKPNRFINSKGLHTLNFHAFGIAVIDGLGHNYYVMRRILFPIFDCVFNLFYSKILL